MKHFVVNYAFDANTWNTSLVHGRMNQDAFLPRTIGAQSNRSFSGGVCSKASPGDLRIDLVVKVQRIDLFINKR